MNVAIITARGGSKGLPRKNILDLCGKPLIVWTIEAALKSESISDVFVSTEDGEIADISILNGAKIINRPQSLASDTSTSEEVLVHAIDFLKSNGHQFDTITLLQPTSPLRNEIHIDNGFQTYKSNNAACVISVFEPCHTPIKAYVKDDNGEIKGLYSDEAPYSRRQDLPTAYQPNGAIYIININSFCEHNLIPRKNVFPYVMSEKESEDIDTLNDFYRIEKKMKELNK